MDLPFNIGTGRTIYSGLEGANRLRMRLFKVSESGHVIGRAWFGPGSDGPPGHVHGGASAYILDELMGSTCWANDYPAVAATIEFQLQRMTPLLVDLVLESRIVSVSSKRVKLECELKLPSGEVCVRGKGDFAILTFSKGDSLNKTLPADAKIKWKPSLKWAKEDES